MRNASLREADYVPLIKLDIDGKKIDWKRIRTVIEIFYLHVDFHESKWSKTNHGFHVEIVVNDVLTDRDICFFQTAMGSDYKRECLNWWRLTRGSEWQKRNWNVLFQKKYWVSPDGKVKLKSNERLLKPNMIRRKLHDNT